MTVGNLTIKPAIESECTLLGGLILNSDNFLNIKDIVCSEDFSAENHKKLFKAMTILYNKHNSFDAAMLIDYMDYDDPKESCHILNLANNCCSTNNLKAHADIIKEKSVRRQLIEVAKEIKNEAMDPNTNIEEFLDRAENNVNNIK